MAKKQVLLMNEDFVPPFDFYRRPIWPPEVPHKEGDKPSPVEQAHKDACDINFIVKRFQQTGVMEAREVRGQFGDFSNIMSYEDAVSAVRQAQELFLQVPAELRARFNHDPGKFIEFLNDPQNADEMVKFGLAARKEEKKDEHLDTLKGIHDELRSKKKKPDDT